LLLDPIQQNSRSVFASPSVSSTTNAPTNHQPICKQFSFCVSRIIQALHGISLFVCSVRLSALLFVVRIV
jgi:hypothetical protein